MSAKTTTYTSAEVPDHVAKILTVLGVNDRDSGGVNAAAAVGRLIGVLAWVSVEAWKHLPPENYRTFAHGTTAGLETVRQLINSANPDVVLNALLSAELKRQPNEFPTI